jgi:hypothetical protein
MARKGCIGGLLSLPMMILGGPKALSGPVLPPLSAKKVHAEDTDAWHRARQAARRSLDVLNGPASENLGSGVVVEVSASVIALVERVDELALQLAEARKTARDNDPDAIARDKAALELDQLGDSSAGVLRARDAMSAMSERLEHALEVVRQVGVLHGELVAASRRLEAIGAKTGRLAAEGGGALVEELVEQTAAAERALVAWQATRAELRRL